MRCSDWTSTPCAQAPDCARHMTLRTRVSNARDLILGRTQRHKNASHIVSGGMSRPIIDRSLGPTASSTLRRYAHPRHIRERQTGLWVWNERFPDRSCRGRRLRRATRHRWSRGGKRRFGRKAVHDENASPPRHKRPQLPDGQSTRLKHAGFGGISLQLPIGSVQSPANRPARFLAEPSGPGYLPDVDQGIQIELGTVGEDREHVLRLIGALTVNTVPSAHDRFQQVEPRDHSLTVDIGEVSRMDTAGAWLLTDLEARLAKSGVEMELRNVTADASQLLESVRRARPEREHVPARPRGFAAYLETTGRAVAAGSVFLVELLGYLGLFIARLGHVIRHPGQFRFTALVAHAEDVGFRAVPIVALMAFLIGVVLAFQGSAQLQQFGAEVFVVDLIAISILRELGILLTAIIVAGRTASAFTAAIGSMKMREEIDAMRTLGLDPATVLFVPRILALVLMLPILGLIANVMGLLGGALMAWIDLGISPAMFRTRLIEGTDISHVFVGLVKAPVFALIIGVVGCHAGMRVKGNAESLGRMTSSAVVTAIFSVIVADALFSIFFAEIGL